MKTLLYLLLFIGLNFSLHAQINMSPRSEKIQDGKTNPPPEVVEAFKKEYPSVTPAWSMDGENFKASFVDPNSLKGLNIVYDKTGNVVRRDSEVESSAYPEGINSYFIKNYPGEKFKTWVSTDVKGARTYFIQHREKMIWFDSEGKYVTR